MRIKLLKGVASVHGGFRAGTIANVPDEVAQRWCKAGIAEKMNDKEKAPEERPKKMPRGKYWCSKCQSVHRLTSPKGIRHLKHRAN